MGCYLLNTWMVWEICDVILNLSGESNLLKQVSSMAHPISTGEITNIHLGKEDFALLLLTRVVQDFWF